MNHVLALQKTVSQMDSAYALLTKLPADSMHPKNALVPGKTSLWEVDN